MSRGACKQRPRRVKDMDYADVRNLGAFQDWVASGAVEK
jgi:hypothetical protein